MTKEELLTALFPEGTELNIPEEVILHSLWSTKDLYDIFFDYFIDEFGDLQIWSSEELEEIFTQMWNEKKEDFFKANPPSEWGSPYHEIIADWIKNYSK